MTDSATFTTTEASDEEELGVLAPKLQGASEIQICDGKE
jgi:hypothetical protein